LTRSRNPSEVKYKGVEGMTSPAISVIVPAYNVEMYIERCMDSIVGQSLPAHFFEIIAIDDCAKDRTAALLKNYAAAHAHIKLVTHDRNLGLGAARNTGLRAAVGEFVVFVDSDDMLRRDALEILLKWMRTGKSDMVVGDYLYLTESLYILGWFKRRLVGDNDRLKSFLVNALRFPAVCVLFRRSWLFDNGIFFKEGVLHEDVLFMFQAVRSTQNIAFTGVPLYYYIQNRKSIVGAFKYRSANDFIEIWMQIKAAGGGLPLQYLKDWEFGLEQIIATLAGRAKTTNVASMDLSEFFTVLAGDKPELAPYLPRILGIIDARYRLNAEGPTALNLNRHFYNKVIFYAEVDYHIRNFASIARALKELGIESVILDVSKSPVFRHDRHLPENELAEFSDVEILEYSHAGEEDLPFTPLCYVFAIDWGFSRNFIHMLQMYGVPVVAFYEGICDDNNVETNRACLPYRLVDYLLLPGQYYRTVYDGRKSFVVGMPQLQTLLELPVVFPDKPLALINLNFTYKVLEDRRDDWLSSAVQACAAAGFDYIISQHPVDMGKVDPGRKTDLSVYDAIKKSTVLISRFSTCVLEALASGKPVIYHNPHGERMDKFLSDPMGAYQVTSSAEELAEALADVRREVAKGVDFRAKGKDFLQWHTGLFTGVDCARESAGAIRLIVDEKRAKYQERILTLAFVSNVTCVFSKEARGESLRQRVTRVGKNIMRDPRQFKYYASKAWRLLWR
jgi:glycosyltransferase involved in cell wall biosynthesis